jgi:hypothetical protein
MIFMSVKLNTGLEMEMEYEYPTRAAANAGQIEREERLQPSIIARHSSKVYEETIGLASPGLIRIRSIEPMEIDTAP